MPLRELFPARVSGFGARCPWPHTRFPGPADKVHPVSESFGDGVAFRLTFRFRSLSFLIRRAVHSPAVAPVLNSSRGLFATASATTRLFSMSGRRTTLLFGRVKNATEYRSYRDWWPGGGLLARSAVVSAVGWKGSHHTMQVGAQDASAEDRQRVPNVANGVARERLPTTTCQCVRRCPHRNRYIPSRKAILASQAARPGGLRDGCEGTSGEVP